MSRIFDLSIGGMSRKSIIIATSGAIFSHVKRELTGFYALTRTPAAWVHKMLVVIRVPNGCHWHPT